MAAEPTTRFAHLLQPIRDLSKVWKIEIAEELEKYVAEVSHMLVTNPEDGISQLNFAEAALLIQGSTAIYSRKVELLYQLVYQALDLLSLDKTKDAAKRGRTVQSGMWGPIPETDELLTIDHLIKEGRNIMLDHSAPQHRQDTQRRMPLFLMPRDAADRRKHEFRISSCTVHHSGVYLLQESDAKLLDGVMAADDGDAERGLDVPLVPAPPHEVPDLDARLQALLQEMPGEVPDAAAADGGGLHLDEPGPPSPAPMPAAPAPDGATPTKTPFAGKGRYLAGADAIPDSLVAGAACSSADPWAMLDEHLAVGSEMPLEVGRTSRRVNAKKLLMNAEGLPDAGSLDATPDSDLWSASSSVSGVAPMLTAGHPVESLFLSVAGTLKAGGRYESQKAGFSAAWLEFEDLFSQATSKRRLMKAPFKRGGAAPDGGSEDEASDAEGLGGGHGGFDLPPCEPAEASTATPTRASARKTPQGPAMTPLCDLEHLSEEQLRQEEHRKEVALLENMIQDANSKYQNTVRDHLAALQKDGEGADKRFPQLYANVKRWQDQLEPVLKECQSRPEFDIHDYGHKFLDKMTNIRGDGETDVIKFSRLVHGQPRWEICRRFLTCLMLTNEGNTDIVYERDEDKINGFSIKLLKAEKKMISLEGDAAAASAAVGASAGRGKRSKAALAPAAAAAGGGRKRARTGVA